MSFVFEEELAMLLTGLLTSVPSTLMGLATYVLTSLALYTIAKRRGLHKPWLAWIPVVNCWVVGSLSDQYQYLVNGQNKSKRKILLILNLITAVLAVVMVVLVIVIAGTAIFGDFRGGRGMMVQIMGPVMSLAGLVLPLSAAAIAYAVVRYMALYDVYKSLDPANCVLFTVLSILFGVTEPFFLFFSRNKDDGMPPRRQQTYSAPEPPVYETYEEVDTDYL